MQYSAVVDLPFLLISRWFWCTVSQERIKVIFSQLGSFPTSCPAEAALSALLLTATYSDISDGLLQTYFIHWRWGSEWHHRRAYETFFIHKQHQVQSKEHPKQALHVSDSNMQLHYQKVIVCYYEKLRAKIKESPCNELVKAECLWNTSCGTSHRAAPEKSLGAHQPDSAKSSASDHSACKTLCRYSAMTPAVSWTPLWQFVHPAPLGEDPGPPPVSEGSPWRI